MHKSYPDQSSLHIPVLLQESLQYLNLKPGMVVVDCTLGLGGHASAILETIGPAGFLYAFERDQRNIQIAEERLKSLGKQFKIFHDSFRSLKDRLRREGVSQVDALLFDLGLSSPHVDDPSRGFSFLKEGPLDMRFDQTPSDSEGSPNLTAADLLNQASESHLADVFYHYGEIHAARKLAHAVVSARKREPFSTTTGFLHFLEEETGFAPKKGRKNLVPQIFQALRIAVNEELLALELGLNQAIELLAPHGRVVVVSYHSLEDRLVKQTFKQLTRDLRDPNDIFGRRVLRSKSLSLLNKKPIRPSSEEQKRNPRSRSALLRAVEKL